MTVKPGVQSVWPESKQGTNDPKHTEYAVIVPNMLPECMFGRQASNFQTTLLTHTWNILPICCPSGRSRATSISMDAPMMSMDIMGYSYTALYLYDRVVSWTWDIPFHQKVFVLFSKWSRLIFCCDRLRPSTTEETLHFASLWWNMPCFFLKKAWFDPIDPYSPCVAIFPW